MDNLFLDEKKCLLTGKQKAYSEADADYLDETVNVRLTERECGILKFLIISNGYVSAFDIRKAVWADRSVTVQSVVVAVGSIRKKVRHEFKSQDPLILTGHCKLTGVLSYSLAKIIKCNAPDFTAHTKKEKCPFCGAKKTLFIIIPLILFAFYIFEVYFV